VLRVGCLGLSTADLAMARSLGLARHLTLSLDGHSHSLESIDLGSNLIT
jgi:hypothetical protein